VLLEWRSRSISLEGPAVEIGWTGSLALCMEGKVAGGISRDNKLLF
jgi:hypothetical protein